MAHISIDNVSVTFKVYGVNLRSLRNKLVPPRAGGDITSSGSDIVQVEALKNITLNISDGDRIGLVGRNGSGKTTLLRTIGGVFEPTAGSIEVAGKIAALTDMGLGMDPEASGYDNILMRCICLGMSLKEARAAVSGIEAFTELGPYLSLPLRTYSTGMAVRLAFAISTNIEPNILLMDEMVGAGDIHFVEKARSKVNSLVESVGILVLASHNPDIIRQFCNKAILLHKGRLLQFDDVETVLAAYQNLASDS